MGARHRLYAVLGLTIVLMLAAGQRAQAQTEYCPAEASGLTAIDAQKAPATLYAFVLDADGQRSVAATVAIDTSSGWYRVSVPSLALTQHTYHYDGLASSFDRTVFESDIIYARFPEPVSIRSQFVSVANGAPCQAPAGLEASPDRRHNPEFTSSVSLRNPRKLDVAPAPGVVVLAAEKIDAPGNLDCSPPFLFPTVTEAVTPQWPNAMHVMPYDQLTALIKVAVNADGSVDDAWIQQPSGFTRLDDAALASAKASTYQAGSSFCRPAPGFYYFRADFRP